MLWIVVRVGNQIAGTCYESGGKSLKNRTGQQVHIDDMQFGCSYCVRSCVLHGSKTWLVRKENDLA